MDPGPKKYLRPSIDEVRVLLDSAAIPSADVAFLDEGWDAWVFRAGEQVVRFPMSDWYVGRLEREEALLQELGPLLPLPVPRPRFLTDSGPNDAPATVYQMVPGRSLVDLDRKPAPGFGSSLGAFLKALQSFPGERAAALGLEVLDGPALRRVRGNRYERIVRRLFPLLACEARTYAAATWEKYLSTPANFDFKPVLCHADIDDHNVLADPLTGEITGIIDFLDADVTDPALDFGWAYSFGFRDLGIEGQLADLIREGGADIAALERIRSLVPLSFALGEIDHALDIHDVDLLESGIVGLNRLMPRTLRC